MFNALPITPPHDLPPEFGTRVDEVMPTRRAESRRVEVMESGMRILTKRLVPTESAEVVALDWESLCQLVRRHTLDAVAVHFAHVGLRELSESGTPRGFPACRDFIPPAAQGARLRVG
jgi:hypothetical protein